MPLTFPPREFLAAWPGLYQWLVPRLVLLDREFPDAVATSWYRSPVRNLEVGGDPRSQHLLGWAADWSRMDAEERDTFVRAARSIGLVAVNEGDHVHVQTFPRGVVPDQFFSLRFPV